MSLLDAIVQKKRVECASLGEPEGAPYVRRRPIDVAALLHRGRTSESTDPLRLLTEVKFRSPSAGALDRTLDAGARAVAYARGGASLVSVLCDSSWFDGSFMHVREAAAALDSAGFDGVPVLAKEFVVDEVQIRHAAHAGASAVLLIVRIVDATTLSSLVAAARATGIEPLVEVSDERELGTALDAGARVIGVNARDLDTLVMDRSRAARVVSLVPTNAVALSLSGLRTEEDVRALSSTRADGALVGEILMREANPEPVVRRWATAASGTS